MDENLKWQSHNNLVCKKVSRAVGVMGRVRAYLSSKELLLLYNALILPHLNYCAAVWGGAYKSKLNKIEILQKRAVRIIDNRPLLFPSNELFVKYKLLKAPDIVIQQNIVILLASLNDNLPSLISNLFKINRPLNTRAREHFAGLYHGILGILDPLKPFCPAPCHEPQAPFTVTSPRLQRRLISLHPIAIHENDADIYEALTPSLWKKSVLALIRCIIQVFQFLKPTLKCQR